MTRFVDLTHPHGPSANVPGGVGAPSSELVRSMASHGRNSSRVTFSTHTGTHLDAPWHVRDDGQQIVDLGLDRLIGPAVVWRIRVDQPRGLGPADFEAASPAVEDGDFVLLSTGLAARYGTPEYHHRPWISVEGAAWLRDHGVRLIGFDFASPEEPTPPGAPWSGFPVHHALLDSDVLIVENAGDLTALEGQRVRLFVIPIRAEDADGFPARLFAEV